MPFHRVLKHSLAVAAFALVLAASAAAQQYQILRADYGHGDQRVDVTQRLREVARSNDRFRMGNSTFGIDPAPGRHKVLRIVARGPHGEERTFEYREGSTVDGAQFAGWGRGEWGNRDGDSGQYRILRAEYGTPQNNVDVTQRLRELARADVRFRMGNSTFGIDPAPGEIKILRIHARGPGGDVRVFEYREGSVIDGAQFTGWQGGNWGESNWHGGWGNTGNVGNRNNGDSGQYRILHAEYGTPRNHVDVTQRLRELARGDVQFRMGNSTFGIDPAPGEIKILRIFAQGPEGNRTFEYREGSTVDGSQFTGWHGGDWGRDRWEGGWEGRDHREHQ